MSDHRRTFVSGSPAKYFAYEPSQHQATQLSTHWHQEVLLRNSIKGAFYTRLTLALWRPEHPTPPSDGRGFAFVLADVPR